jgi:alpha-beta hydrolase superfamily lysophospholipase
MSPGGSAAARLASPRPITRSPLYFGDADRPLFGWYHAPRAGVVFDTVAVICPSIGHEYVNAHRSVRHLADQLAAAGIPALRFDYCGTGDSAGHDQDRLEPWLQSIQAALAAARETSDRDRLCLIGLRMGATMAASVTREVAVANLVLWGPAVRGRAFLRELRALELTTQHHRATTAPPRDIEAGGFRATPELQRDISALDLERFVPRARRVLIADRDDRPEAETLAAIWSAAGVAVDRRIAPGFAALVVPPHNTVVPTTAVADIAAWVAASASLAPPRPRLVMRRPPIDRRVALGDVEESVLRFGADDAIFGIVSEPVRKPVATVPAVVLSNAGSAHHVGPNGLYVRLARSLARAGFRVLRFDLPGLGDSVVDDPALENAPYPPNASACLARAMDALTARSDDSAFVLMGLCSGAHASFHAAVDLATHPVVEAVLINPLTFAYRPGMSLDAPSAPHVGRWRRYRHAMTSLHGWAKLFRPEVSLVRLARDVVEHGALVSRLHRRSREPSALEQALARLSASRRRLTLVCSRYDPGYDLLMLGAGAVVRTLKRAGELDTWFIDDANHTFDGARGRAALVASITRTLSRRYLQR